MYPILVIIMLAFLRLSDDEKDVPPPLTIFKQFVTFSDRGGLFTVM